MSRLSFANVSTLASYNLMSQTMDFTDLTQRNLAELVDQLNKRKFDLKTINSASLIIHEASHYLDHLATLSGQEMLVKIYTGLNEVETKQSKNGITELLNILKSWSQPPTIMSYENNTYYKNHIDWKYDLGVTRGLDIFHNTNNELFMSALFKHRSTPIAKIPFCMEALWETNAIWAEVTYNFSLAVENLEDGAMEVELYQMQNKYKEYLYNPELLVYSLAAHFTSSFANYGDLFSAFKLSKALASISLNLPLCYYPLIKRSGDSLFNGLPKNLLEQANILNPCAVYLALLENIVESELDVFEGWLILDINKILSINCLPDKSVIKKDVLTEMSMLNLDVNGPHSELYQLHNKTGMHLFNIHGIEGGLNTHPGFLIDLANKSQACVFQGLDDYAIENWDNIETEAYRRQDYFNTLLNKMHAALGVS